MFLLTILLGGVADGGQGAPHPSPSGVFNLPPGFDGPPPPVPPAVISREAAGRATIRAVSLAAPIRVDGRLDEAVYASVPAMSDFIQNDPIEGAPATEKTETWIFFDRDHVYVVARCWESHPERLVANEMRRDNTAIVRNDNFAWSFDTFYDRRNAVIFEVSAVGGRLDGQVTNELQVNIDWNPVWDVKVGRFEGGWAMEAAIPFKSLRYRSGGAQIWGFQARRVNRWKNEVSYLTPLSASQGLRGHFRASLAATLVGLEGPGGSKNLEVKPYVTTNLTSDTRATPSLSNDLGADLGVDLKYGIGQNLTLDVTYNTDFAQVEADEQQVNLTRFSLFFPEKRDFFLENRGIFSFGGVSDRPGGGGGGPGGGQGGGGSGGLGGAGGVGDAPMLFYSRRIGLDEGREVPIVAGGRLTGRLGLFSIGLLNIQTAEGQDGGASAPARASTNFSVVRVKRDVLRRSSVGVLFTGRSVGQRGTGSNQAYGVDATFGFFDDLSINTYWARTRTDGPDGLQGDDASYRVQLDYAADRYGVQLERLVVGDHFNPEVGFVRRDDTQRNFAQLRFSPRPRSHPLIRRLSWTGSINHVEDGTGRLETREWKGEFAIELHNSDRFAVGHTRTYEFLPRPFPIAPGITLPVTGYDFGSTRVGYFFGPQRVAAGDVAVEHGTFYGGHKTSFGVSQGRVNFIPQLTIEPRYSVDRVDLPEGAFTTHLVGARVTYTMTPLMFTSALLQYNAASHAVMANVRLRWEYRPGSELFIVLNEERDSRAVRFPALVNRAFLVKINRLFRF